MLKGTGLRLWFVGQGVESERVSERMFYSIMFYSIMFYSIMFYSMLMKMPARMTEVIVTVMKPPTSILGSI